jgi:hypothetical protein
MVSIEPPPPPGNPLPKPDDDPVTGDSATDRACENPLDAELITPVVFAFFDTSTAIIATPMMAVATVTTELTSWFPTSHPHKEKIELPPPKGLD